LERRVAIAEFMGELDLDRNMGQFLNQVLAYQSSVPARTAGGNHDTLDRAQSFRRHVQSAKARGCGFKIQTTAQSILDRARLLEDFFQHEMSELAALGLFRAKFKLADLNLGGRGPQVLHIEPIPA